MKIIFSPRMALVVAAAVTFLHQNATAATIINYGDASGFSVMAGTEITDAGGSSSITGNVGVYPGTSDGLIASQVTGTIYSRSADDVLLLAAKTAFDAAKTLAAGQTPFTSLGQQLGGLTLVPGVYRLSTLALLDRTLTLNGNGQANPSWIFQGTDSLVTGSSSSIIFENGGIPCDVLWEIPTQATLGTDSTFVGTIMAGTSIVMDNGARLDGRAWADAAVTLDHNTITGLPCTSFSVTEGTTVPDTGSTLLLLGSGLATLLAFRRRFFSPA